MKGLLYYSNNRCQDRIANLCRHQIERCRKQLGEYTSLVSITQHPLNFGYNVVVPYESSILSMFKQNLKGLKTVTSDIVFFVEHDVLYHFSHFEFTPPRDDVYYFNTNVWSVDDETGQALYYDDKAMVSGLVANRELLIDHYERKIPLVEKEGFSQRKHGFEPGKMGTHRREFYQSDWPNCDIKSSHNISKKRFDLSQYRSRKKMEASWTLADRVPWWGVSKGRFDDFLREVYWDDDL